MTTARKIGSDADDELLKRDPWRALMTAAEMNKGSPDDNPAAHYWSLAAYAWHAEHDRVKRRSGIALTIAVFVAMAVAVALAYNLGRIHAS